MTAHRNSTGHGFRRSGRREPVGSDECRVGSGSGTERSAASTAGTGVAASAGSIARTGTRAMPGTTTGTATTATATAPSTGVPLAPAARAEGLLQRMARIVAAIPAGRVATYGQVAALAGNPRAARQVAWTLRAYAGRGLPWHRVVGAGAPGSTDGSNGSRTAGTSNSTGATAIQDASVRRCRSAPGSAAPGTDSGRARRPESPPPRHRWGAIRLPPGGGLERQRALLLREGVAVDAADRIDLARYQWGG